MSAYRQQETKFKDEACLKQALIDNGYAENMIEVHEQPQTLIDYHGHARPQKANVIIRKLHVGAAANDIGFIKNDKTGCYEAIISDYDRHRHNAAWMTKVGKSYAEHRLLKQSRTMGLLYLGKQVDAKGRPQLKFAVQG